MLSKQQLDIIPGDSKPNHNKSEAALPFVESNQVTDNAGFNAWFKTQAEERDIQIREAFRLTNERLDTSTRVDCMMSGTTVVMVLLYGNMLVCANAGDSRAVLFSQINTSGSVGGSSSSIWKTTPLSRDHKPEENDEAARVWASNGRIEQS